MNNISIFISNLITTLNSTDFICKSTPLYIIIRARFHEHYNLLLTDLMETDVSFHTFLPNVIRCLLAKIVIRNLHLTTSYDDIIAGLLGLRHHVTNIYNIKRFPYKSPFQFFSLISKKMPTIWTKTGLNFFITQK